VRHRRARPLRARSVARFAVLASLLGASCFHAARERRETPSSDAGAPSDAGKDGGPAADGGVVLDGGSGVGSGISIDAGLCVPGESPACDGGGIKLAWTGPCATHPVWLSDLWIGLPFEYYLPPSCVSGPEVWSTSGSLPPGLTFQAGGWIHGTPTQLGIYPFTVTVQDNVSSASVDVVLTVTVLGAPLLPTCNGPAGTTIPSFGAPIALSSAAESWSMHEADLNGDGLEDLLSAGTSLDLYQGLFDGGLTLAESLATESGASTGSFTAVTSRDVNSDGYPDLAALEYPAPQLDIFLSQGPSFVDGGIYPLSAPAYDLAIGSLNGDGQPDLFVCGEAGILTFVGIGGGAFRPGPSLPGFCAAMSSADLNGDGRTDLVVIDQGDDPSLTYLNVYLSQPDGTLQLTESQPIAGSPEQMAPVLADLNADGLLDISLVTYAGLSVLRNLGSGWFDKAKLYPTGNGFAARLIVREFNDDCYPDIVTAGSPNCTSGQVALYLNQGDGTFSDPVVLPTPGIVAPMALATHKPRYAQGELPGIVVSETCASGVVLYPNLTGR